MIPEVAPLAPPDLAPHRSRGPLLAALVAGVTIVTCVAIWLGWMLGIAELTTGLPARFAIRPDTALGLILVSVSIAFATVLSPPYTPTRARVLASRVAAAGALAIGGFMLLQFFLGSSSGLETFFASIGLPYPNKTRYPVSPATPIALVLLSVSMLILDSPLARLRSAAQWPALVATITAFVIALGHLYNAEEIYRIEHYAAVALTIAVLVMALGTAIVQLRPDRSLIRELVSPHFGGLMARPVLPLVILLPVVLGWACVRAQNAGWFPMESALAVFTASNVVLVSLIIWLAAGTLNRADADRRAADFEHLRALSATEARWRALIEASASIVFTAGSRGEPQYSPLLCAFTGQSEEQWRLEGISRLVHPDDWESLTAAWRYAIQARKPFDAEYRLRHHSGEYRWLHVRAVPLTRTGDADIAWIGMGHDITDRRQNQALTEGQRHVLELIARGAPISDTLHALSRIVEEQCEGLSCSILMLEGETGRLRHGAAPRLPEAFTRAIDGVSIGPAVGSCGTAAYQRRPVFVADIETDLLWADFRELALAHGLRACWSMPIIEASGRVLGTLALYRSWPGMPSQRDIRLMELATHTAAICLARHHQVQALRESEARFRQLAESLPQMVWMCGPDTACDYLNQQWLEYTGQPAFAQLGFGWQQQIHPADREATLAALREAMEKNTDFRREHRIRRHDGVYRWFDARVVPLHDASGRVVKWIGSNTDVDDRKRFEEAQLRSQKLESLGTLAGGIAHDFNNMLLVILGNAQIAQDLLPEGSEAQEHLAEITQASERAADLVRRILSFSRPQKARHKVLQLAPVVEESVRFARAALPAMVEIRMNLGAQVPSVSADATQIHQVVLNLATNAAHAIGPKGGLIEFDLKAVDIEGGQDMTSTHVPLPQVPPGRYVRLTVRDNGCGMPPDVVERVFDPFFTTKPVGQGTGLGLPIVHGILRSSGGAITVQSEPGKGSAFHLFFPAAEEAGAQMHPAGSKERARGGTGQHVLFIDDEDAVVRLGTLSLTRLGYRVTGCTDPEAALREFHRNPHDIDAVVTDLSMPGKSGFDCAREMLAHRPGLPIVLTSGYLRPEDEAQARDIGIRKVRGKPEAISELGALLEELLAEETA